MVLFIHIGYHKNKPRNYIRSLPGSQACPYLIGSSKLLRLQYMQKALLMLGTSYCSTKVSCLSHAAHLEQTVVRNLTRPSLRSTRPCYYSRDRLQSICEASANKAYLAVELLHTKTYMLIDVLYTVLSILLFPTLSIRTDGADHITSSVQSTR